MSRRIINEFGVQIYGATIGDTWAGLSGRCLTLGLSVLTKTESV